MSKLKVKFHVRLEKVEGLPAKVVGTLGHVEWRRGKRKGNQCAPSPAWPWPRFCLI